MHLLITRRRHLGQAIDTNAIRRAEAVRGDVEVRCDKVLCLGRESHIAQVRVSDPMGVSPLPALMDASLSWMATNGFVLSGIEEVDGVLYAQSWWCREG